MAGRIGLEDVVVDCSQNWVFVAEVARTDLEVFVGEDIHHPGVADYKRQGAVPDKALVGNAVAVV